MVPIRAVVATRTLSHTVCQQGTLMADHPWVALSDTCAQIIRTVIRNIVYLSTFTVEANITMVRLVVVEPILVR